MALFSCSVVSWWGNNFTVLFCGVLPVNLKGSELQQEDRPTKWSHLVLQVYCVLTYVLWAWFYYKATKKSLNKLHFQSLSSENIYYFMIVFQVILANFSSSVFLSQEPSSPLSQTYKTLGDKKLDFSNTNCWQLSALYRGITDCSFNELSLIHWGWIIFNAELFSSNWPRIPAVKSTCQIMLVYKYISRQQKVAVIE